MTLKQVGVVVAVAGAAVAAWLGIWTMVDRRFAEMRAEMQAGFSTTNARLDDVAAAVNVLVGRQQERDRDPAD